MKEMSGSRRVQARYKLCWSVEVFKYSVGYCRVPYLLSGISGYVGYFRVFRVDTIFLVAPKCRVYPKYQVMPDISGYPMIFKIEQGLVEVSIRKKLGTRCQCYILVGRPPLSPQTAIAKCRYLQKAIYCCCEQVRE